MADAAEAVRELEAWVRQGGGYISDAVSIRCGVGSADTCSAESSERGAFAGPDGLPGERDVCRLPLRLLLTESFARQALPFGEPLCEAAEQFQPQSAGLLLLAAQLLWDGAPRAAGAACAGAGASRSGGRPAGAGGAAPHFLPYYRALSADLGHLPTLWAPEDRGHQLLRGTRLEKLVKAKRHSLGLEFALLQSCAPELGATLEEYLWARGVVSSRAYALQIDGRSERCLVPWADLLNHGGQGGTAVHYAFCATAEAGGGCFLMRSDEAGAPAHREVRQSYGAKKSNASLLLDYGFVLPREPGGCGAGVAGPAEVTLVVRLPARGSAAGGSSAAGAGTGAGAGAAGGAGGAAAEQDEEAAAAALRQRLWRAARRPPSGASVDVTRSEPGSLFSLLRVATAGPAEAEALERIGAADATCVKEPLSPSSERCALEHLQDLVSAAVARLEEGPPRAAAPGAAEEAREACAVVAEEELSVLRFYRELAEAALSCLGGGDASGWLAALSPAERAHAGAYLEAVARCGAAPPQEG